MTTARRNELEESVFPSGSLQTNPSPRAGCHGVQRSLAFGVSVTQEWSWCDCQENLGVTCRRNDLAKDGSLDITLSVGTERKIEAQGLLCPHLFCCHPLLSQSHRSFSKTNRLTASNKFGSQAAFPKHLDSPC